MDWLSSDTAVLEPLLWAAAVLCLGWILFMRSLRELKLSDCGNLRIKGFWRGGRTMSISVPKLARVCPRVGTHSGRRCVFHLGPIFIGAMVLLWDILRLREQDLTVLRLWRFIFESWWLFLKAAPPVCGESPANHLFYQDFLTAEEKFITISCICAVVYFLFFCLFILQELPFHSFRLGRVG